jgi:hypothetical protein
MARLECIEDYIELTGRWVRQFNHHGDFSGYWKRIEDDVDSALEISTNSVWWHHEIKNLPSEDEMRVFLHLSSWEVDISSNGAHYWKHPMHGNIWESTAVAYILELNDYAD